MALIANSAFTYADKKYFPGQPLPKNAPKDVQAQWLSVGYAVQAAGKQKQEKQDTNPSPEELAALYPDLPFPDKDEMSEDDLKALALKYGVDASEKKTKDEIIALIMAAAKEKQAAGDQE